MTFRDAIAEKIVYEMGACEGCGSNHRPDEYLEAADAVLALARVDEDRITALVHDISCNNLSPAHKTHPQAWCRLTARRLIAEVPLTLPTELDR